MSGSKNMVAEFLEESSFGEWNRLLRASRQGSIYSTPEYLAVLSAATGGRFRLLGIRSGSELVGGVALFEQQTPVGRSVSGRYLLYYNSLVLRDYETRYPSKRTSRHLAILTSIEHALSQEPLVRVELNNYWTLTDVRPFLEKGWKVVPGYTYVVDTTDSEALLSRMDKNFRRLIGRCENQGFEPTEDDDFDELYRVHVETAHRKWSPVYLPKSAFTNYFRELRDLGLCRLDHLRTPSGKSVASQLTLLGPFPVAHTVCAGADPEYMNLGTTPFLRWSVMRALSAMGYQGNDLTDAALSPVTRFKSQLGADLMLRLVVQRREHPALKAYEMSKRIGSRLRRWWR